MELITDHERKQLIKNFQQRRDGEVTDPGEFVPVVHTQTVDGLKSWMLTELSDEDNDAAYGLFTDYKLAAEIGPISLRQMAQTTDRTGMGIFKVLPFDPPHRLAVYQEIQRILVENDE